MQRLDRWNKLWRELSANRCDADHFERLMSAYSEPHRHYHTLQHLDECFERFDELRETADRPAEIELALWFHDAIYDVRAKDNEARSADWAVCVARRAALPDDAIERIHQLIMVTCHDAVPRACDERVLVDVDLAILAAEPARFDEYEAQVRAEYAHVPAILFRRGRRKILESFLERPTLFSTPRFIERYEANARRNLARSIEELS